MSAPRGLDIELAYWLAHREVTARRRSGRRTDPRLLAHVRALSLLLESEGGPDPEADGALSNSSGTHLPLTSEQAAAELGVTPRQARRLGARIGGRRHGGHWLFDPQALSEHREGRTLHDA